MSLGLFELHPAEPVSYLLWRDGLHRLVAQHYVVYAPVE